MDGLPYTYPLEGTPAAQRTLKTSIDCIGVGVHSGRKMRLGLHPASVGAGITFRRSDLGIDIPARFDNVADTRLCTMLASPEVPEARVGTVEHIMAAFAGTGVTNALVEVDGPEIPILDGSAANFLFLLECAGVVDQPAPPAVVEVLRPVRVEQDDAFAELHPSVSGLELTLSIVFDAPAIGEQALSLRLSEASFRSELARARTFTLASEVMQMQAAGLGLGGSLENAVIVDHDQVLNPGGLRMPNEFVRHKLLDAVGDLALCGGTLQAAFVAHRSGHALNNRLLRALFADEANWRLTTAPLTFVAAPAAGGWQQIRLPIAAAPA